MNDPIDISKIVSKLQDIQITIQALPGLTQTKRVYDTTEAAEYLGMSGEWLKKVRKTGIVTDGDDSPKFIKIGRSVRYLKTDLDDFLETRLKYNHLAEARSQ